MGSIPITRFHSGWTAGPRGMQRASSRAAIETESSTGRGEHERHETGQIVEDMTDKMLPWLSW